MQFVEAAGIPAVLYIKSADYVTPETAASLVVDGLIAWIKYAIVREEPGVDQFLDDLIGRVDPKMIVSGIGEQPAAVHLQEFGLGGFTSGCVCVAPAKSTEMLAALKSEDREKVEEIRSAFRPLEDLRNTHGPIPVLHHAVAGAGIAETGPHLPLLAPLPDSLVEEIGSTARHLLG